MENSVQNNEGSRSNLPVNNLPHSTPVLVLGICSIVGSFLWMIPGIVCGIMALVFFKSDKPLLQDANVQYSPQSISNLKTGRVLAIIGLCLSILILVGLLCFFGVLMSAFMHDSPYRG